VELIAASREAERTRGLPRAHVVVRTGEPAHASRARVAGADLVLIKQVDAGQPARAIDPAQASSAADAARTDHGPPAEAGRGGASAPRE
jgi:hypothetical protein